jgi:hypothetical protein
MKKILIFVCAMAGMVIVDVSAAQAAGGRRRVSVTYSPTPSVAVAQGQSATGYRTYSYEPGSNQPAVRYRSYSRSPVSGFHDAAWKIRGGN